MSELEDLTRIILAILGNNNEERHQAETLLRKIREENFNQYVYVFCSLLNASPDKKIRIFCVVHLRRLLSNYVDASEDSQWDELNNDTHKLVKQILLEVLVKEEDGPTRRVLCDFIGELSATIKKLDQDIKAQLGDEGKQWDSLMPNIWNFLNSGNSIFMECALKILGILFIYCGKEFANHKNELFPILSKTLENPEMRVKAGAIEAISNFIGTIQTKHCKMFSELIPKVLESILQIIANNEDLAIDVLNDVNDMVASEPKIFKPNFKDFIDTMRKISEMNVTIDSIKANALEIVVLAFEMLPLSVKAEPQVIKEFFESCFAYMVHSVEDIDQQWLAPPEGFLENDEDSNPHDSAVKYAMHLIDRVVSKIGSEISLPLFSSLLVEMVKVHDWRFRYSALMGLSQVGEYITNLEELDNVVDFTLKFFKDEHPKVRYAACHCIGQIAEDSKPQFQTRYTHKVLPACVEMFGDEVPRVIAHDLASLTNFLDGCEKRSVTSYITSILEPCIQFLSHSISLVKENAMSVISTLAEASQKDFTPYWEKTAQIVFGILEDNTDKVHRQVRGQAIETLVLVGESVGKEEFKKGAHKIIEKLIEIQKNFIEEADPQKLYLLNGWQRICVILKEDLAPYLEHILPSLFDLIEKIIHSYKSKRNRAKGSEKEDVFTALKGGNDRPDILHIANTSESQEIVGAVKMISVFVIEMKNFFGPYVERTSDILTYLLEKSNNINVKLSSARGFPGLINVIQAANINNKEQTIRALATEYCTLLWKVIDSEIDPENRIIYVMVLRELLKAAGTFMTEPEVQEFNLKILTALKESDEIKVSNEDLLKDDENEIDEEEEVAIKQENATEEELHCALAELIGAVFETHKQFSMPLAHTVYGKILPNVMVQNMSSKMYKFGLFLVDNIIEYLGMELLSAEEWSRLGEIVLRFSTHKKAEVRHPAVYGVGLLAEQTKENFQNIAEICVKTLLAAIAFDKTKDENPVTYGVAKDNAIASLGKVIKYQNQFINTKELTHKWFKSLPLRYDKAEAREQHDLLLDIIIQSDPALIFGEKGEHLPFAIKLFAVLVNSKFVYPTFTDKMRKIIENLMSNAESKALLTDAIGKLDEILQDKLKEVLG